MQNWAETQRRLWDGWMSAMTQAVGGVPQGNGANPSQFLGRALDTWEPFVRETLDAQSSAVKSWVEGLMAAPNIPPQMRTQLEQLQEMTRGWTETQRQMWDAMFAAVRQLPAAAGPQQANPIMAGADGLQAFARPMLEAQATWLRQWAGMFGGAPGEKAGRA